MSETKELREALDAAMQCIKGGLDAVNASYRLASAEQQGLDRTAEKLDREISAWRATARAMLSAHPALSNPESE